MFGEHAVSTEHAVGVEHAFGDHALALAEQVRKHTSIRHKKRRMLVRDDEADSGPLPALQASVFDEAAEIPSPEDRAAFNFMVARMYAQAGDLDHSLEYLRKAMEEGYKNINQVYTQSEFASLRTDKRFNDLMAQKPQAIQ